MPGRFPHRTECNPSRSPMGGLPFTDFVWRWRTWILHKAFKLLPLSAWIPVPYYGDDTQGGNRCDLGSSLCGQQYLEERQREGVMGFTVLLQGEGTPTPVCTSAANEGTGSCSPYQNNESVKASLMTKASYGKCLLCTYTEFFLLRGNSLNNSTWLLASLSTILGSRKFDYKHCWYAASDLAEETIARGPQVPE